MLHSDPGTFFALARMNRRHYLQSRQNTPKHFSRRWSSTGNRTKPFLDGQRAKANPFMKDFPRQSVLRISLQGGQGPGLPNAPPHSKAPARQQIEGTGNTQHQLAGLAQNPPQPKVLNAGFATPTKQQPSVLDLQMTASLDHQRAYLDRHDALHLWPGQRSHPHHLCVQQLLSYRHATMRKSVPLTMGLTCLLSRLISTKP